METRSWPVWLVSGASPVKLNPVAASPGPRGTRVPNVETFVQGDAHWLGKFCEKSPARCCCLDHADPGADERA